MKIAFNTWMYAAFPAWLPLRSLDDVIDLAAEMGFDGLEIGAAAPHAFPDYLDAARRKDIRARLDGHGLEVSAMCPTMGGGAGYNPASPEAAERQAGSAYVGEVLRLAADIGCPTVIHLGGYRRLGQPYAEAWAYAVEGLQNAAKAAREHGVKLAVEPTSADSNLVEHAGDALRIIEDAGVADVAGVMLDTFHIYHRHDEVREAFAVAGDQLTYVHLADLDRDPPGSHRDFTDVIEGLRAIGYDGWLSLEVGFNRRESHPDALLRAGMAHIRGLVDQSATASHKS
ncbi:MAG: D-psicose/D-tagatose/L-ribulose 3-epimerase [Solirubrobacteraceae bacterium]|nr:D-psicose/D-tagatose/L-ribulose 3-epimerase [Solirubrobacteraceae bacterium]